jgi:hypothetical protein
MKSLAERFKEIEDLIEEWHNLGHEEYFDCGEPTLHEYLGWTWDEYKVFTEYSVLPQNMKEPRNVRKGDHVLRRVWQTVRRDDLS